MRTIDLNANPYEIAKKIGEDPIVIARFEDELGRRFDTPMVTGYPELTQLNKSLSFERNWRHWEHADEVPSNIHPAALMFYGVENAVTADRQQHRGQRDPLESYFTREYIQTLMKGIRESVDSLILGMRQEGGEFDMRKYSSELPMRTTCTLLGIPLDYAPELKRHVMAVFALEDKAVEKQVAYWRRIIEEERYAGNSLIAAILYHYGSSAVFYLAMLASAGFDTTDGSVANTVVHMLQYPQIVRRIRAGEISSERFRWESMHQAPSVWTLPAGYAVEEVELGGYTFRPGEPVWSNFLTANRDQRRYNGQEFRLDRPKRELFDATFGLGIHRCLGIELATLQHKMMVDAIIVLGIEGEPADIKWSVHPTTLIAEKVMVAVTHK